MICRWCNLNFQFAIQYNCIILNSLKMFNYCGEVFIVGLQVRHLKSWWFSRVEGKCCFIAALEWYSQRKDSRREVRRSFEIDDRVKSDRCIWESRRNTFTAKIVLFTTFCWLRSTSDYASHRWRHFWRGWHFTKICRLVLVILF